MIKQCVQAKKKGQQDKAAGKSSQSASSSAAQLGKSSQADSSESEEDEERERFSLQDSRFASLVGDSGPPAGAGVSQGGSTLEQGSQPLQASSSTHAAAAGSSAADSSNEEEGGPLSKSNSNTIIWHSDPGDVRLQMQDLLIYLLQLFLWMWFHFY